LWLAQKGAFGRQANGAPDVAAEQHFRQVLAE
jgi:hypothetical protein